MNTATRCWRGGRALVAALTAGLTLLGALPALATTAADYARRPALRSMVVSPANTHAALLARAPSGRTVLTMLDLKAPGTPRVIKAYDDVDIVEVSWVNDRRLVYSAQQPGAMIEYEKWGTFAIDLGPVNTSSIHQRRARS